MSTNYVTSTIPVNFCHPSESRGRQAYTRRKRGSIVKLICIIIIINKNITKKALITGITGQDGSYLTELLLEKGYEVHGIIRHSSSFNTGRINHLYNNPKILDKKLFLHYGDLTDSSNIFRLIEKIKPDEIYNLGAQSHVKVSFEIPGYTCETTGLGTLRILDAIKDSGIKTKFYQASSSEMFGLVQEVPQSEKPPSTLALLMAVLKFLLIG